MIKSLLLFLIVPVSVHAANIDNYAFQVLLITCEKYRKAVEISSDADFTLEPCFVTVANAIDAYERSDEKKKIQVCPSSR